MPYTTLPGFPEKPLWQPAPLEAGRPAMLESLRECLDRTIDAAYTMTETAAELKRLTTAPEPPLSPPETLAATIAQLDNALTRTIQQWREIARSEIVFYAPPESEVAHHTTLDAVVDDELNQWPDFDYPETMAIAHYRRMPVEPSTFVKLLEDIIYNLDEEHGGDRDEGGIPEPSPELQAAEQRFIQSTLLEYRGYWLEIAAVTAVNIRQWQARHRPDLFRMRNHSTAICHHCYEIAGAETMKSCPWCRKRGCARCWLDIAPATLKWHGCQVRHRTRTTPAVNEEEA